MKKMIAILMLSLTATAQTADPAADTLKKLDALVATYQKRIERAGHETLLAQQAMLRQFPETRACEKQKWPDSPECNLIARAIAKSILIDIGK